MPTDPESRARRVHALIAHDGKKADMVAFATFNRDKLAGYRLIATATTGRLLSEKVGLEVEACQSGPLGGDVQIAARVADGEVDAVFFLVESSESTDTHRSHTSRQGAWTC